MIPGTLLHSDIQTETQKYHQHRFAEPERSKILRYGAPVGCFIEQHTQLGRCMERLKELLSAAEQKKKSLPSGMVVTSAELLGGNGRFGRYWHAPRGGLWLAMAWADTLLPDFSRLLPLAAGIACCEAVRMYNVPAAIKWVNDIHVDGRKLAGILSETIISPFFGERYHLLGIGMNINNNDFPEEFSSTAVNLSSLAGHTLELEEVLQRLLARLGWNIGLLHYQEELSLAEPEDGNAENALERSPVLSAWYALSDTIGRRVLYGNDVQKKPLYEAMVCGVDTSGGLVMQMAGGRKITEYSGEIIYLG